jgi:hypothetical protein
MPFLLLIFAEAVAVVFFGWILIVLLSQLLGNRNSKAIVDRQNPVIDAEVDVLDGNYFEYHFGNVGKRITVELADGAYILKSRHDKNISCTISNKGIENKVYISGIHVYFVYKKFGTLKMLSSKSGMQLISNHFKYNSH